MEALQHEFEECRMKQVCLSQEFDVLSQIYAEDILRHHTNFSLPGDHMRVICASVR
jgi:hypothetical protein